MHNDKESDRARVDFEIYRGDTFTRLFLPIYKLEDNSSVQVDMTGWTGLCQIRNKADGPVLLEASTANGRMITGPQNNGQGTEWQLLLRFSAIDTRTLPAGFIGEYDIELTRPDGSAKTWYYGRVCVEGDISHG